MGFSGGGSSATVDLGTLDWKQSVRVATTVNGTLASAFENGDTVDGVVLASGNRILIKNQTAPAENGIYTINASGAPTRAADFDSGSEVVGSAVLVEEGTVNADTAWVLTTNGPITLGTTALSFSKINAGELATLQFVIDGGGSAITTGVKGYIELPFAGTIIAARLLADQSGSIVVDIWKDSYANYPPVDADSITASAPPTLASAAKSQDTTLTGWNTAIAVGDILGFNVDSATTVTRVTVSLTIKRT